MVEYTILLEGLEVTIGLGIHDHERATPQRVAVSVWLTCAYDAVPADLIEAVVDYDYLRAGIRALAATRHIELQETLCEEVARLALAADPRVRSVKVRSMKLDVYPDARVGCEVERMRD
ncbi:dihydroneopterin aldolase [Sphingomonas koreensis]|jgi:dihydroneopterin aldolase|uniref:dihydroneopterin aldolase n=1 Tax=Sphingomonas koreensis TaxID=93064 RepID=A0A1L6JDZ6_9SPHN|nr:dihydroneopterin aldolase [Sphingomonas koreensis]APR54151.1 dihydroneopterin aldolase [Sphingomonas koreensis]MDC7809139.1 dihydroneopterin aldolase [Sphingomonas koreensis]RSU18788.1 dihydroneopterin aldolase [Sphingomonas koreensis]RSU25565.1 dihydroneopterin aldolase [Sphingomonas koreensis]RSU25700.1 dihydroneopterin aldolase [Sphingomonas koreensis]